MALSLAICAGLVLLVAVVFGRTLNFRFLHYDDQEYVSQNPYVKPGLTWRGLAWSFSPHASNWHPLTWMSHMLDCQVYGPEQVADRETPPWGHHLTNLVLHAAAAILLYGLLRRTTGAVWPSAWVAAVFAIHPLRAESVAWIAERKDVLSGLFFMLTLWAYAAYARRPGVRRYLLVVAALCLGLMAKPMLVTVPGVLLLLDVWPLGRLRLRYPRQAVAHARGLSSVPPASWDGFPNPSGSSGRVGKPVLQRSDCPLISWRLLVLEKLPLLAIAIASSAVTMIAQRGARVLDVPFGYRLGNALVSCLKYVEATVYPVDLAVLYPHPREQLAWGAVIAAAAVLLALTAVAVLTLRRRPYVAVGWFWYLGMLVPVLGLVQVGVQARADRYTYLPQIGLLVAVAWAVAEAASAWRPARWAVAAAGVVCVAVLARVAYVHAGNFRDAQTLWRHALACTEGNIFAHDSLAQELARFGRLDESLAEYQRAVAAAAERGDAQQQAMLHNSIAANVWEPRRDPRRAEAAYREALGLNPEYAEARNNLAMLLQSQGRLAEAEAEYREALRLKPDFAKAHCNFAALLSSRNQWEEGAAHFRAALRLMPELPQAHNGLGCVLLQQGRLDEAEASFRQALHWDPDYETAKRHLAEVDRRRRASSGQ